MRNSKIAGVGHYVPEKVVTNDDLAKLMDTSDDWIRERTGIRERRYYNPETDTTANMGVKAAKMAMEDAGISPSDIDFIVFATLSPDYFFPGPGVSVQEELGIGPIGALDVRNQCSGFIYALSVADNFIKTGMYNNVLVIGSEIHSSGLDFSNEGRSVSVIFGDGAGAVVLTPSENHEKGILSTHLHSEGKFAKELCVVAPSSSGAERITEEMMKPGGLIYPIMNGNYVFKHAVQRFPEVIGEALNHNGYSPEDVDILIPHQANLRITKFVQETMKLPDEKVVSNIQKYGNTTAASIPIALSEAKNEGRIKDNDLVCMAAFGSGFTWASALIRW
ncbi:3-oxoacyl-ACP synthase III family protein [Marinigracilibium pacificum]|uniref:Beta-ketoacyl-[acyl-carrier-protein] synthase III n=1 Tax=Marinigracilibium pacificum TaxID=2729599 RepID=A0A848J4I4_9BACT|nr:beta-ketoacyl-ACP synthase III [Marinigracilibium pacificum]NMM49259.1 ketoacyl-ACP synthase III [Marinigracilibium pacificum]